jgi:hypothetical protein
MLIERSGGYEDKLPLTDAEMRSIFDPAVDKTLDVSGGLWWWVGMGRWCTVLVCCCR